MLCPRQVCILPALLSRMPPPGPQHACMYWQCGTELLFVKLVDIGGSALTWQGVPPGMWVLHLCLPFLGLLHPLFGGAVKDCRKNLLTVSSSNECA